MQQHVLDDGIGALAMLYDLVEIALQRIRNLADLRCYFAGVASLAGSVARSPKVGCFGSFVKPTADGFKQRSRLIKPASHPPEFCKACGGAQFKGLSALTTCHVNRLLKIRLGFSNLRWVECYKNLRSLPMQFRFP
jgi:hypothetical protein